jgi:cytochrome c-type biogenesis protein CcmF
MLLAHVGVAVFIIGVTLVTAYEAKHEAVMKPNDQASVAGYGFTFLGTREVKGPNYSAVEATITVRPPRGAEFTLKPQRRVYAATRQAMTEADIDSGVTRDVLVNISEQDAAGGFLVAMHVKPFVDWIWLGCVLMALGGVLAISDRRYRLLRQRGVNTVGSAALTGTPGVAEGAS